MCIFKCHKIYFSTISARNQQFSFVEEEEEKKHDNWESICIFCSCICWSYPIFAIFIEDIRGKGNTNFEWKHLQIDNNLKLLNTKGWSACRRLKLIGFSVSLSDVIFPTKKTGSKFLHLYVFVSVHFCQICLESLYLSIWKNQHNMNHINWWRSMQIYNIFSANYLRLYIHKNVEQKVVSWWFYENRNKQHPWTISIK